MKRLVPVFVAFALGMGLTLILSGCAGTRIRRLSGPDFAERLDPDVPVSSFHWTTYVGQSVHRAYLEVGRPALLGRGVRTTVYWAPVPELPADFEPPLLRSP